MTPSELRQRSGTQLLDVRLADDFEAAHLEGAINNCVFEVAFGDRLGETAPDPEATTVVYGADESSAEAAAAAEKLQRAGYRDVHLLEGGFSGARAADLPVVSGTPLPEPPRVADGAHSVDLEESRLRVADDQRGVEASKRPEERVGGIDMDKRDIERAAEELDHIPRLVVTHEAMINEHAGELVADRLVNEHRGYRGINAA